MVLVSGQEMKLITRNRIVKFLLAALVLTGAFRGGVLFAAGEIIVSAPVAGVAVFGVTGENASMSALGVEAMEAVRRAFNDGGRFIPADENQLRWAVGRARERQAGDAAIFEKAASLLNADLCLVVSVNLMGGVYTAEARVLPVHPDYEALRRTIRVRSRIMTNIPLKLRGEILRLQRGLPLAASIIRDLGGDTYLIDAGQWQGLKEETYRTKTHGPVDVLMTSRYESVVKIPGLAPGRDETIAFPIYPEVDSAIAGTERLISDNTVRKYGLDSGRVQGEDPRKRYLEGMCIINPGGNICLPVYGSYLSTFYLGFKDKPPDVTGMALSSAALGMQLLVPSVLTGFEVNFLPWVKDGDKSDRMQRLQVFLWAAVPVTFSVSYLDQLAVQFSRSETLPPFFGDRDTMAATLSLFIPGGGLFYKGRRTVGWSFYLAEMLTAGYGIYRYDSGKTASYALIAFGAVKAADILYSWLARPGYAFYNIETDTEKNAASLSLGAFKTMEKESVYTAGVSFAF